IRVSPFEASGGRRNRVSIWTRDMELQGVSIVSNVGRWAATSESLCDRQASRGRAAAASIPDGMSGLTARLRPRGSIAPDRRHGAPVDGPPADESISRGKAHCGRDPEPHLPELPALQQMYLPPTIAPVKNDHS